ncbi:complement C4 [Protobothrops mucrosquamatus]|uniref:complement C4 n=1 Tax=Protobothrops mucrosquamatus TaxID=103944 RepID=UPI0007759EAB|nr:complement C4 [Protobothrops mucrosquamatus]
MVIVDISLLSGFQPDEMDLAQLQEVPDQYINHWEIQGQQLLLYFDQAPESGRECVAFRAKQVVSVGKLQPASATVYDFYEPSQRCSIFYGAPNKPQYVSALCSDDVCQCAEGCHARLALNDLSFCSPQYLLDKNSWIEEQPDPRRCKATQYRNTCQELQSFTTSFGINGCRI